MTLFGSIILKLALFGLSCSQIESIGSFWVKNYPISLKTSSIWFYLSQKIISQQKILLKIYKNGQQKNFQYSAISSIIWLKIGSVIRRVACIYRSLSGLSRLKNSEVCIYKIKTSTLKGLVFYLITWRQM